MKKMYFAIIVMALVSVSAVAQNKVADKELIGVWLMESMQWEGENKIMCGDSYGQFKYFGADGEYACAEITKTNDGRYLVLPHEYGTYTFKNGVYTEMGRSGVVVMKDKETFQGTWMKRHDVWKKKKDMPKELVDYIISLCKANQPPTKEMQQLIKKHCLNAEGAKSAIGRERNGK